MFDWIGDRTHGLQHNDLTMHKFALISHRVVTDLMARNINKCMSWLTVTAHQDNLKCIPAR